MNIPERTTVCSKGATGDARERERDARERVARAVRNAWRKFVYLQLHLGLTNEIVTLSRVITESLMARDNCVESLRDILTK